MKKNLTRLLLLASGIAYIWAIMSVGNISLAYPNEVEMKDDAGNVVLDSDGKPIITVSKPPEIEEFFLTTITLIGTALAIHTGRLLGITLPTDDDEEEDEEESRNILRNILNHKIVKWLWKTLKSLLSFDLEKIPEIATVLYITGLVVGVYFYFREDRSPASAELLKTSWASLLGLFAGVWAADDE